MSASNGESEHSRKDTMKDNAHESDMEDNNEVFKPRNTIKWIENRDLVL